MKVDRYHWNRTYDKYKTGNSQFLVHDVDDYCRIGDKVVIKLCRPISKQKYYYVRNVIIPVGRHDYYNKQLTKSEKDALEYNKELRNAKPKYWQGDKEQNESKDKIKESH